METCEHLIQGMNWARDELRTKQATLSSNSVFTSDWNLQTLLQYNNNIVIENKPLSFLPDQNKLFFKH